MAAGLQTMEMVVLEVEFRESREVVLADVHQAHNRLVVLGGMPLTAPTREVNAAAVAAVIMEDTAPLLKTMQAVVDPAM